MKEWRRNLEEREGSWRKENEVGKFERKEKKGKKQKKKIKKRMKKAFR